MAGNNDLDDDQPLDPAVEEIRRRMVRLMVISISIMVVGIAAVLGSIIYKVNQPKSDNSIISADTGSRPITSSNALKNGDITLPAGSGVISSSLNGDRILLTVKKADGSLQMVVFDMIEAKTLAIYRITN